MATRRFPRRGSSKLVTQRSADRQFARKNREKLTTYCGECNVSVMLKAETCPNGGAVQVVSNSILQSVLDGAVRLTKLEVDLFLTPYPTFTGDNCEWAFQIYPVGLRWGLLRDRTPGSFQQFIPDGKNPLDCGSGLGTQDGDWGEQPWIRSGQMFWPLRAEIRDQNQPWTCCPNVTAIVPPIIAGEQPGWTIQTDCIPCDVTEAPCQFSYSTKFHEAKRLRFTYRPKPSMQLRDADSLNLWFGWEALNGPGVPTRAPQPDMTIWGYTRISVER